MTRLQPLALALVFALVLVAGGCSQTRRASSWSTMHAEASNFEGVTDVVGLPCGCFAVGYIRGYHDDGMALFHGGNGSSV